MDQLLSKRMKKLIVCCDGTWMNSNQGASNGDNLNDPKDPVVQGPTNVTRICRCVKNKDSYANNQITYYQSGIGTYDFLDKIVGGMTGAGLGENIREAYQFIASNYDQEAGDEISLVGFSRGAFTARSIAAFIGDIGLLTPAGMVYFYPIFQDWENQLKEDWAPNPNFPWKAPRPSASNKAYVNKLYDLGYTRKDVKIKALACFDTVGSLGIPRIGIFKDLINPKTRAHHSVDYSFIDTRVSPMVEHAIHAVALDEKRQAFAPTMWELPTPQPGQTLTQCWFTGAHSDVGGYWADSRSADISLTWMINQLKDYITFDYDILRMQYYKPVSTEAPRPWSCGVIHNPFSGFSGEAEILGGIEIRSPMEYSRYNWKTGEPFNPLQPLESTYEKIHPSVRMRMAIPGKGLSDKGNYIPEALHGWKVVGTVGAPSTGPTDLLQIQKGLKNIQWQKGGNVLPEEILSPLEYELLRSIVPSIEAKLLSSVPK